VAPTPGTTHFSVSASTTTSAGAAITVTVTPLDSSGNKVMGYTGTVRLTSTDLAAVLPASKTLISGVGVFTVTLKTAGSQSIIATDSSNGSITGSANVTVLSTSGGSGDGTSTVIEGFETSDSWHI